MKNSYVIHVEKREVVGREVANLMKEKKKGQLGGSSRSFGSKVNSSGSR